MNHAELSALVVQFKREGKNHMTLPVETVEILLDGFEKPKTYGVPWPVSDLAMESA